MWQITLTEAAPADLSATVLKRSVKRPRIEDSDRVFWILMRRTFKEWRDCLHLSIVDSATS